MINSEKFIPLNEFIVEQIKRELRLQGHYDTGALERSFDELFEIRKGTLVLTAKALGYLEDLENGVSAENIDEKGISINRLAGWVQRKGIGAGKDAKGIAIAIVNKWKRLGKPLEGSRAFSQTGDIILAIEIVFQHNESFTKQIDNIIFTDLDEEVLKTKSGVV